MGSTSLQGREIAERALSLLASFRGVELTIVEGAHDGASLRLGKTPLRIGSAEDDDVVLFADALAPDHAEVSSAGLVAPALRIAARAGGVEIEGRGRIAPGREATLPLPLRFEIGGAVIEARARSPLARLQSRAFALVGAAALGGVLLAWGATELTSETYADSVPALVQPTAPPVDIGRVNAVIEKAGLAGMVKADPGALGGVVLSGRLEGERATRAWRRLLESLDSDPGAHRLVNLVSVDVDAPKPPAIGSVWLDARPRVLFADGQKVVEGGRTAEGWTVARIADAAVTLMSPAGAPFVVATPE